MNFPVFDLHCDTALALLGDDLCQAGSLRKNEFHIDLERAKTLTLEETDFLRMKRSSLGRRIRELDSFDSTCFRVCAYHFSEFDYFDFPRVFHSVTAEEVLDFIRRTVTPQRCCLSVIEPLQQEVTK